MGQRPAYHHRTSPVAVRLPEEARRIFEWLTLEAGAASLSAYLRDVLEQHLRSLGFQLVEGTTAALPQPTRAAVAQWQHQEAERGQEPDPAVG